MSFEFISQIQESRLISNKRNLRNYTHEEIEEITFLYFLTIQILRNELEYVARINRYVSTITQHGNFDLYISSANDLYQLLHILYNKNAQTELKSANKFSMPDIRSQTIRTWLRNISDSRDKSKDHRFLFALENGLNISNNSYKAIRRLVEEWDYLTQTQKQLATTRLLQALRFKARKSELLPWLEQLSKKRNLELTDTSNPEENNDQASKSSNNVLTKAAIYTGAAVAGFAGGVALHRWLKK